MSYYSSSDMEYDNGYSSGENYHNRYDNGYDDGYSDNYNNNNYGDGYDDSDNGYDDGYNDSDNGYDDSDDDDNNADQSGDYQCQVPKSQFSERIYWYFKNLREDPDKKLAAYGRMQSVRKHMNRVYCRNSILFCIDIEAWEQNHDLVTEVGVSIYDPRYQESALVPNIKTLHMTVAENKHLKNGKHVADNKDNFMGKSTWNMTLDQIRWILQELIDRYFDPGYPFYCSLVGHDLRGDLQWLDKIGVYIPSNVRQLDTQTLFAYTHGRNGASLGKCLRAVNQPFAHLHNAGNDAYYTILLALKLCDPNVRDLTEFDRFQEVPTSKTGAEIVDDFMSQ
ncbi:hypothetical protein JCM33374_g5217 [Metschnikowia sp. JCM 33374]|nr:hypothetical protein JCM33374_g5217 [Metschnikowia sp. JCM 33374]